MADELKLVSDTLEWLNSMSDDEINPVVLPKMRSLVVNLINWQYGFSLPLDYGLIQRHANAQPLPFERPLAPLIRWKVAYKVDPSEVCAFGKNDNEIAPDGVYAIIGGETWQSLVENGKLTGEDAVNPETSIPEWLTWLWQILEFSSSTPDLKKKSVARRLAACWYHISTVISFDPADQTDAMEVNRDEVMAMLLGNLGFGVPMGDEEYEEFEEDNDIAMEGVEGADELVQNKKKEMFQALLGGNLEADINDDMDEDYDPSKDPDNGEDVETDESFSDEEKETGQGQAAPSSSNAGHPADEAADEVQSRLIESLLRSQDQDDDDDEDYDPMNDPNDDGEDVEIPEGEATEMGAPDEQEEGIDVKVDEKEEGIDVVDGQVQELDAEAQEKLNAFRAQVLKSVDLLGAQWPDFEDQGWLRRILKMMAVVDQIDLEWYPWGLPPLAPLQKSLQSTDEFERNHAQKILTLYRPQDQSSS